MNRNLKNRAIYLLITICAFQACACFNEKYNMIYKINFYTQYKQFYICDKLSSSDTDSDNFWTEEAHKDRLAIEDGILGIGTECYGPVNLEIIVLSSPNNTFKISSYDHIVEGGLELESGMLQIADCPNFNKEFEVNLKPGKYRIRVYSGNLASVLGNKEDDFYKIEIWPSDIMERKVLKRYKG